VRPLKANDPTLSILISSSQGYQKRPALTPLERQVVRFAILGLRQCYAVWGRRRSGGRESRETAALRLGTARAVGDRPAALVLVGSAFAAMATPAKNAAPRTVDLQE
jgi:hypothetical protein